MMTALAVAVGGAAGSLLRYWMSVAVQRFIGSDFPLGTLAVNVIGCFVMGVLYVVLVERSAAQPAYRALLMIGVLGGFTTFSSFSMETLNLLESGELMLAIANVVLSVSVCLGVCWLGAVAARAI